MRVYWRLVRDNANFRRLLLAQIASEIGDWFYSLAIYSLLLGFTGRASAVSLAVVLQVLPQTLAGPTAGIVNDRISRRQVMIAADLMRCVVVLGMLLVRSREMVWLVYVLLTVETVMAAFFEPARTAVLPKIISASELLPANAMGSMAWSFSLAAGATLGGITATLLGRDSVFLVNAASFLLSAWLISRMQFAEPHADAAAPMRTRDLVDFSPTLEGARYVRAHPQLISTIFAKAGFGIVGANLVILPVLGERNFGGVMGMSLLMGARGVGALIGPIVATHFARDNEPRMRRGIMVSYGLAMVFWLCIGLAPALALACLAVGAANAAASTNWVFSSTLLQTHTEDRYRGRVFSADMGLLMLSISISVYIAGLLMDHGFTAQHAAMCVAGALLAPAAVWYFTNRKLW